MSLVDQGFASAPPPLSRWVSEEARRVFEADVRAQARPFETLAAARAFHDDHNRRRLETMRALFPVETHSTTMGGVPVDVVVPPGGALRSGAPVLVCLHGGGFAWGAGAGALLEAVPIAAVAEIAVVAVDYRMAPEHRHPAALEDIVAVYRALLADRPAERIGVYGCSAGAVLTAQTTATLQALGEPRPGATAMFHAAGLELDGDLLALAPLLTGDAPAETLGSLAALPYFAGANPADPVIFPGEHPHLLADFPPSLLITSTRDFAASSVSVMHRRLLAAGAEAEFILFDGLWHAFHMSGELPESRELYARVADFFRRRLG
jgi:epsilon-lactone hydrolase